VLPVGLDERPGDGEAEAGPAAAAHPVELLEDLLALVGGNARPAVGHRDAHDVALGARRDDDGRILGEWRAALSSRLANTWTMSTWSTSTSGRS